MKPKSPIWLLPVAGFGIGLGLSLLALVPMWLMTRGGSPQVAADLQGNTSTPAQSSPPASAPEPDASDRPAPSGTLRIKDSDRFGCSSRDYMDRLTKMSAQGDKAATENGIRMGFASGQCVPFTKGEPVYVEKTDWGMIEVRRPGESTTYWTFIEAAG